MAVTDDTSIYRAAMLYIVQHGDQATKQAAIRANAFLEAGDVLGCKMWQKIITAIELLQTNHSSRDHL